MKKIALILCLVLVASFVLSGCNNSDTKGNGDKLLDILLTASKKLKRSLAPTGNLYR